jgi:hypothetical protein
MSSWEKVSEEHRQQESFRKRCYQRLQEWKKDEEIKKQIWEMMKNTHMPPNSGFSG